MIKPICKAATPIVVRAWHGDNSKGTLTFALLPTLCFTFLALTTAGLVDDTDDTAVVSDTFDDDGDPAEPLPIASYDSTGHCSEAKYGTCIDHSRPATDVEIFEMLQAMRGKGFRLRPVRCATAKMIAAGSSEACKRCKARGSGCDGY